MIKPGASLGGPGPHHPVPVNLAGFKTRDEDVPVMIGPVLAGIERNHLFRPRRIYVPEQEQFHSGGAFGENAEVNAFRINRGSQGKTTSWIGSETHGLSPDYPIGSTSQTFSQYSRMARSEENLPIRAALRIDIRVQRLSSRKMLPTSSWRST